MRKFIFLIIVLICCFESEGQDASNVSFGIGEKVNIETVIVDKEDNTLVSGNYSKDNIDSDLIIDSKKFVVPKTGASFCVKLNSKKEIQWLRYIESYIKPTISLIADDSSNIYMIGMYYRYLKLDSKLILDGNTNGDIFIAKYSSLGQLKWIKHYGGEGKESLGKPCIDKNGNLYLIGGFDQNFKIDNKEVGSSGDGNKKSFVLKLNSNGGLIWFNKHEDSKIAENAISVNLINEVFVTGTFEEKVKFNSVTELHSQGMKDIFYAKYAENGELVWVRQIGGVRDDICNNIETDNKGNVFLAGIASNNFQYDTTNIKVAAKSETSFFLLKTNDKDGKLQWSRSVYYDKTEPLAWFLLNDLEINDSGEPYILGFIEKAALVFNSKTILEETNGGVVFLVKYSAEGNIVYVSKELLTDQFGYGNDMVIDSRRNIFIAQFYNFRQFTYSLLRRKTELDSTNCATKSIAINAENNCGMQNMSVSSNLININNDFDLQWYKNDKIIKGANKASYQTTSEGYYTLGLTHKTIKTCEVKAFNSILATSKEIYTTYNTDLKFHYDYNQQSLFSNSTTDEWYRNNRLIQNPQGNLYNPEDGTYKIKRYNTVCNTAIDSKEIIIQDGKVIEIIKETINHAGDDCEPIPFFKINSNITSKNVRYQWFLNNTPIRDSTQNHLLAIASGNYLVSIFLPDENKTYTSAIYRLEARDFPKSLPIIKIEDACGTSALLKIDDTFILRYVIEDIKWSLDGKEITDKKNQFIQAVKSGSYTSSIKFNTLYSDKSACTYNSFTSFDKKPDFNLNIGYAYAGSGCLIDSFKVFVEYNKNYQYEWTKNDTLLKKQNSNELFINDKSVYKGFIKREDGCVKETEEIFLKGCTPDSSKKFLMLNPPVITADKTNIYFNEKSVIKADGCTNVDFQWLKDMQPIVGATQPNLELKQSGNYSLQIGKLGCIATSNPIKIVVENILSAENEIDNFEINVFPNPAAENLSVEFPQTISTNVEIMLTDISGKLIKSWYIDSYNSSTLDIRNIPEGVYLLNFEIDGKRYIKKIIKKY